MIEIKKLDGDVIHTVEANTLAGADLTDAKLCHADLHCTELVHANLTGVNLHSVVLCSANLVAANLHGANLSDANFTGADFTDADLTGTNLTGADLTGVISNGCGHLSEMAQLMQNAVLHCSSSSHQDNESLTASERIQQLSSLTDGWYNGTGLRPTAEALASATVMIQADGNIGRSYQIYPTEDGGILFEKMCNTWCYSIEISPDGKKEFTTVEL